MRCVLLKKREQYVLLSHRGLTELHRQPFSFMNLTEQQPNKSAKPVDALHKEKNGTRFEYAFFPNLCEPKFRFVETNIISGTEKALSRLKLRWIIAS